MNEKFVERNCLDPWCPCQDGDPCHYKTYGNSPAWPIPIEYAIPGKTYERVLPEDLSDEIQ